MAEEVAVDPGRSVGEGGATVTACVLLEILHHTMIRYINDLSGTFMTNLDMEPSRLHFCKAQIFNRMA